MLQFQSGHFKSKQFSFLRASLKGVSAVGLMHPNHANIVADENADLSGSGSWKKCKFPFL